MKVSSISYRADPKINNILTYFAPFLSLVFLCGFVIVVRNFFFPRENGHFVFIVGLLVYVLAEFLLVRFKYIKPVFLSIDENLPAGREVIFLISFAMVFSLITKALMPVAPSAFLFACWLVLLAFNSYITYQITNITHLTKGLFSAGSKRWVVASALWIASFVILAGFISFYPPMQVNPAQEKKSYSNAWAYVESVKAYSNTGVFFTVPIIVSADYPLGYGRFEQVNNSDDVGYIFIQALAQRFHLEPSLDTNILINRAFYIIGSLLFAFILGIFIIKSPIAFLAIGCSIFVAHGFFSPIIYQLADHHGAVVGMAMIGMSVIALIPFILNKSSFSTAIWFCFTSGLVIGFLGMIRQNVGYTILGATLFLVFVSFVLQLNRRKIVKIAAILALLIGYSFISVFKETLFLYRDSEMQIHIPPETIGAHGIYYSLLGNVTEWNDTVIEKVLADENPMALSTCDSFTIESETKVVCMLTPDVFHVSRTLFFRRVLEHPRLYFRAVISNIGKILALVIDNAALDWIKGIVILIFIGGIGMAVERRLLHSFRLNPNLINKNIADESLMGLAVFCVLNAVIPAVTNINLPFLQETLISAFVLLVVIMARIIFVEMHSYEQD